MRDRLLRALRGEPVDTTPIWLMRQAGRHLPGYRALRQQHGILEMARTPELAAEVTLEPMRTYDLDAGVVFADITLPFAGLGIDFRIDAGTGPVIQSPVRNAADIDRFHSFDADRDVGFVGEAIRRFREACPDRPILGFAGAPFTLAAYLLEGAPSKEFLATRTMLHRDPTTFDRLLGVLGEMTVAYLRMQVRAGAHALQLFDSWAGALSYRQFERHVAPVVRRVFEGVGDLGVPTIYFSTGSAHLLPLMDSLGSTALGVDHRVPLGTVRRAVGDRVALQGNLDPATLLADRDAVARGAHEVLAEVPAHRSHVFNLGHGVLPETDPARVTELVEIVHRDGVARR
ncbi:MAG: uroporphyrinogen decarboxylase [Thermoplasmata archaeon]|nr:uroporphyrinogen decarboxylase [Thermoplasmata archaeon]